MQLNVTPDIANTEMRTVVENASIGDLQVCGAYSYSLQAVRLVALGKRRLRYFRIPTATYGGGPDPSPRYLKTDDRSEKGEVEFHRSSFHVTHLKHVRKL